MEKLCCYNIITAYHHLTELFNVRK